MTLTVEQAREWFAEDLRVRAGLRSTTLVQAFAEMPRERFLGPGPWTISGPDPGSAPVRTIDEDPRRVYHDVSVAIDETRSLFNGQPAVIGGWLDALAIAPGERVLHVGCGTGYYTAIAALMTGPSGSVAGIEADEALARRARDNVAPWPWISIAHGDGRSRLPDDVDVAIVNAGATHVLDEWLDVLRPGGRLLVPLTVVFPGMPGTLSKGIVVYVTRHAGGHTARAGSLVVIYSLQGARSDAMNEALGRALMRGPRPALTRLRRDPHDTTGACWLHGPTNCLSF